VFVLTQWRRTDYFTIHLRPMTRGSHTRAAPPGGGGVRVDWLRTAEMPSRPWSRASCGGPVADRLAPLGTTPQAWRELEGCPTRPRRAVPSRPPLPRRELAIAPWRSLQSLARGGHGGGDGTMRPRHRAPPSLLLDGASAQLLEHLAQLLRAKGVLSRVHHVHEPILILVLIVHR